MKVEHQMTKEMEELTEEELEDMASCKRACYEITAGTGPEYLGVCATSKGGVEIVISCLMTEGCVSLSKEETHALIEKLTKLVK